LSSQIVIKLRWYNVDPSLIQSLLQHRTQKVCMKCKNKLIESAIGYLITGVPQGACTSCLLFCIMINDLPLHLSYCLITMFADDGSLKISCKPDDVLSTIKLIEQDLCSVNKWLECNRLEMNYSKVQFMVVARPHLLKKLGIISLQMNNVSISRVDSLKILGCTIDDQLSWCKHLSNTTRKCFASLSPLFSFRNVLSVSTRKQIVNALILSKLKYAASVWFKGSKANFKAIDKIIKACGRFVLGLQKYDCVSSDLNNELKWLKSKYLLKFECLKICYHIINLSCPNQFKDYLLVNTFNNIKTRQANYCKTTLKTNSLWGKNSFRQFASHEWINLPESLKNCTSTSFNSFKSRILEHLLHSQSIGTELNQDNVCSLSCVDGVLDSVNSFCD